MNRTAYELDFYGWANEQAELLREGRLVEADIAEEIESMGRSEKRESVSRPAVLLTHLLKWRRQPAGRGSSWRARIAVRRRRLAGQIDDNPSLKVRTKLGESAFPETAPWSFHDVMNPDYRPD